jgi:hypothetical protein
MPANNQLSPGVVVLERDLSTSTVVQQGTVGAITGPFRWGPVNDIVECSEEDEVVDRLGKPDDYNYEHWFSGIQFLNYGGLLKAVRTDSADLRNAVSDGTATPVTTVKIRNSEEYTQTFEDPATANAWHYAVRYPGTYGNSIRMFVTDAGADQILALPAPGSGNEWEFVSAEALSAASGAAGKVYNYRIKLTLTSVVGTFAAGATTTIDVAGSSETVTVVSYDAKDKVLEIQLPAGGITGILAAAQTITQGTNTAAIAADGIKRELLVKLNKGSVQFAASDSVDDTNTTSVTVDSVRAEYPEREYLPGQRWISVAPRPGTSRIAFEKGGHNDELHILVMDFDGGITGTPYQLVEKFLGLSKASDGKSTVGETNYYKEVLKQRSNYIYWGEHTDEVFVSGANEAAGQWGLTLVNREFNLIRNTRGTVLEPDSTVTPTTLGNSTLFYDFKGGADYQLAGSEYQFTSDDLNTAYSMFDDPESVEVNYIIGGPTGVSTSAGLAKIAHIVTICEKRKDCMAFFSPLRANIIGRTDGDEIAEEIVKFFDMAPSSSYVAYDSGYKYIYDKYNDKYRYIPCNADVAGLVLNTALTAEPWFSPAGFQRGNIRNSIRLAFSPKKDQRDKLYASRVNPVVTFPGQGTVLYGDKTALSYASAFDRINVRRLFIVIEKVISTAAKTILFEQNDDVTRNSFIGLVEPYMRDVQGRRGVYDFLVKCNASNNPPDAIDRGEFYAEIFVKPTRTINYITLTFTATRTGVNFSEVAN